jgi:hypothetical protein
VRHDNWDRFKTLYPKRRSATSSPFSSGALADVLKANIDYPRRAICPIREVNQSKAPHSGRIVAGAGAGNQGKNPAASGDVSEVATLLDLS